MLSKSKIFFKGIVAVLPHMLSVIPFGIITGAIGVELGFDPVSYTHLTLPTMDSV